MAQGKTTGAAAWRKWLGTRNIIATGVAAAGILLDWLTPLDLLAAAIVVPLLILLIRPVPPAQTMQVAGPAPLPRSDAVIAYLDRRARAAPGHAPSVICLKPRLATASVSLSTVQAAQRAGRAIRDALRAEDVVSLDENGVIVVALSARQSGSVEVLIQVALRLQEVLRSPVPVDGGFAAFTTAIALCPETSPACARGARACIAASMRAVERAEADGTDTIDIVEDRPVPGAPLPLSLALDLEQALADGQIVPFFQPQVCTDTGALTGVEALARWMHPEHGLLAPAKFLTTISAAGAERGLTEAITRHALDALADWDRRGLGVPRISVNMTQQDLADPRLAERLDWHLDSHGLAPARLGIEVLETVLGLDADGPVPRTLAALADRGFQIDLDDFGTGQASIAAIRRFRIDRLKIDRSFVRGLDHDPDQQSMVAAMVTMAEQLKLDILAEGVESAQEHARAAELGCRHVQGYGIGRPMRADALPGWLAGWRRSLDARTLPDAFRHLSAPPSVSPKGDAGSHRPTGKTA